METTVKVCGFRVQGTEGRNETTHANYNLVIRDYLLGRSGGLSK